MHFQAKTPKSKQRLCEKLWTQKTRRVNLGVIFRWSTHKSRWGGGWSGSRCRITNQPVVDSSTPPPFQWTQIRNKVGGNQLSSVAKRGSLENVNNLFKSISLMSVITHSIPISKMKDEGDFTLEETLWINVNPNSYHCCFVFLLHKHSGNVKTTFHL